MELFHRKLEDLRVLIDLLCDLPVAGMVQVPVRVPAWLFLTIWGASLLMLVVQCLSGLVHPLQMIGILTYGNQGCREHLLFPPGLLLWNTDEPLYPCGQEDAVKLQQDEHLVTELAKVISWI